MACAHCLRGPSQAMDMTEEVLYKTLSLFDDFSEITFTGGEPSLNAGLMEKAIDYMENHDIQPNSFFVATNGKENVDGLLHACDRLYTYVQGIPDDTELSHENKKLYARVLTDSEENMSALALSSDRFHECIPWENLVKLASRSYFSKVKMSDFDERNKIIRRGNATNLPETETRPAWHATFSKADDDMFDTIYVNAEGFILADCDQDYESQKYETCGNVLDENIKDVLENLLKTLDT